MIEKNLERIWKRIEDRSAPTLSDALGIEVGYLAADGMRASMPVDHRTVQYHGMLHGGASVALAELLASCAGTVHVDMDHEKVVGLEINANHIRGVPLGGGKVHGSSRPIHIGRRTQVWQIEIVNEEGKLVCSSRCTLAVVPLSGTQKEKT